MQPKQPGTGQGQSTVLSSPSATRTSRAPPGQPIVYRPAGTCEKSASAPPSLEDLASRGRRLLRIQPASSPDIVKNPEADAPSAGGASRNRARIRPPSLRLSSFSISSP